MAVINTGLSLAGLRSEFFKRFDATETYWQDLTTRVPSTKATENYRWLGSTPQMREWGTGRVAKGLRPESYDVDNLKYEATLEVDRDEVADDQSAGQINIRVQELATRAATHKDYLLAQLLINGDQTGFNSYDGVTFFNTAHVSGDSGNQSNALTIDISAVLTDEPDTPTAPSAYTCRYAVEYALSAMMSYKDDRGEYLREPATGIVVAVAPAVMLSMREGLQATTLGAQTTGGGSTNVGVSSVGGAPRVIAIPDLTGEEDEIYVFRTGGTVRPFIFQDREPIEFTGLEKDSDEGFRREKYLYGVRARYRVTYGQWMHAVRVVLS